MNFARTPEERDQYMEGALGYLTVFCAALAAKDPSLLREADRLFDQAKMNPLGPYMANMGKNGAYAVRNVIARRAEGETPAGG